MSVTQNPVLEKELALLRAEDDSVSGAACHAERSLTEEAIIADRIGATELLNAQGIMLGPRLSVYEQVGDGCGQFQKCFPSLFWEGKGDPSDENSHRMRVTAKTGYKLTIQQSCFRDLDAADVVRNGEFGSIALGGFGSIRHRAMLCPATNRGLPFALLSERRRLALIHCRSVFMRKRGERFNEMSVSEFVELMKTDETLLADMNRSTKSLPGFKSHDRQNFYKLQAWCAAMAFFDGTFEEASKTQAPRRFASAFGTTTVPLYKAWGFVRRCLIADGRVREYMVSSRIAQFKMRYELFKRHSLLGTQYSFALFKLLDEYERKVSGLADVSAAVENHQDGRPHRHSVYTYKGSGNPCTVSEPSFCDDFIPLGILISWFYDPDEPVACFLRGVVLRRKVDDDDVAALEVRRDSLGVVRDGTIPGDAALPLPFVRFLFCELRYRKDLVPGADSPCSKCVAEECSCCGHHEAVRLLFLVMAVESLTCRLRHLPVPQPSSGGDAERGGAALGVGEWLEALGLRVHVNAFRQLLVDTTFDLAVLTSAELQALLRGVDAYWVAVGPLAPDVPVKCLSAEELKTVRAALLALGGTAHRGAWVDIHWLDRRKLPADFKDAQAVKRSNDDFFLDFQFF